MVSRFFSLLDRTVEIIIIVSFFLMVLVGGMQVFCRYGLKNSLSWSEEFQKFMHIWVIFLAIPLAYKKNAHIGMKVIFDKLHPKAQYILILLFDVLWLGFGGVLVYYTTRIMSVARNQTSPGLGIRMDLVYVCIVIGGIYLCLMAVRKIAGHVTGAASKNARDGN